MKIMSRKSKTIKLLYFNCSAPDDSGKVTVKYRFSNAVSYRIDGRKLLGNTLEIQTTTQKVEMDLVVNGLFRKSRYVITVQHGDVILTKIVTSGLQPTAGRSIQPVTASSLTAA